MKLNKKLINDENKERSLSVDHKLLNSKYLFSNKLENQRVFEIAILSSGQAFGMDDVLKERSRISSAFVSS